MPRSRPDGSPGLGLGPRLMSPPPAPRPGTRDTGRRPRLQLIGWHRASRNALEEPAFDAALLEGAKPGLSADLRAVAVRRSGGSYRLAVSAMQTTILQDWVDESTPATSVRVAVIRLASSADAEQLLDGQPLQPGEAVALGAGAVEVVVLERRPVRQQLVMGLAVVQRRLAELGDPGGFESLLHLGVSAERLRLLAQAHVELHVGQRRFPHAVDVLGAQRLVVEVPWAVVNGPAAGGAVLQQVDGGEGLQQVAVAEDQVLVVAGALLAVEVDVEQLVLPQRLRDAVGVVEAGHLLVPGLRIDADHVVVLELGDEGERMPDRGQQDVAAGLVRLGLDGEPHAVVLVDRVLGEKVDPLSVAVEGGPYVLGEVDLRAFPAAPEHVDLGAELGGEVHVVHDLAQGVAADCAVVAGEAAVLEDGVAEQVGRDHGHHEAGLGQGSFELVDDPGPLAAAGSGWDQVVVVELDAVRAELGEFVHRLYGCQDRPGGLAEQVAGLPADGPQAEAELVLTSGLD